MESRILGLGIRKSAFGWSPGFIRSDVQECMALGSKWMWSSLSHCTYKALSCPRVTTSSGAFWTAAAQSLKFGL